MHVEPGIHTRYASWVVIVDDSRYGQRASHPKMCLCRLCSGTLQPARSIAEEAAVVDDLVAAPQRDCSVRAIADGVMDCSKCFTVVMALPTSQGACDRHPATVIRRAAGWGSCPMRKLIREEVTSPDCHPKHTRRREDCPVTSSLSWTRLRPAIAHEEADTYLVRCADS
jgi:hypothetical protein